MNFSVLWVNGVPELSFSDLRNGLTVRVALMEGSVTYQDGSFQARITRKPDGSLTMESIPRNRSAVALVTYEGVEGAEANNVVQLRQPKTLG